MQRPPGPAPRSSWLDPLYTADEMRALDRWAIVERGIPSLDLMERAGVGVARAVADLNPTGPVRIVCGKGNNAGDGLVVARRLRELGLTAEAFLLWPPSELSDDARVNHERLVAAGDEAEEKGLAELQSALAGSGLVVDALLGTGFTGTPRDPIDRAIAAINEAGCPVVAIDVPSGIDASSGEVAGACVRADVTVTFHAAKVGLYVMPGKAHAGRVEVVDIGIPQEEAEAPDGGEGAPPTPRAGLIQPSVLELLPRRDIETTKFGSGSVLVVGGSTGLTGAVCLAAEGAMRAGAGWVRAAVPGTLNTVFEQKLTEVMTIPLSDRDGRLIDDAAGDVLSAADRADAVVLGPGLGRAEESLGLARSLATGLERPLLVDADGLNALAETGLETVAARDQSTVLTPHAGELARLLETDSREVSARRLAHARDAAGRSAAIVILKGDDSLVVDPEGRVGVSAGGSPALATAGTGDVLSGVIAAFLAKRLDAFGAACAGVYAHSQAGWLAAVDHGADSVIASDVVAALPAALRRPGLGEDGAAWPGGTEP